MVVVVVVVVNYSDDLPTHPSTPGNANYVVTVQTKGTVSVITVNR